MNALELMLSLLLVRLILPFLVLILIGEWIQRRERARFQPH